MSEKISEELFIEPLQVLDKYSNIGKSEMSRRELCFLCNMIKKTRPRKLVEVGVAQGGTTAIILECLRELNCTTDVYSVDINHTCWSVPTEQTGYVASMYIKNQPLPDNITHKFVLGNTIAKALESIGNEIDFLILDTMHFLPGELLDLISIWHSLTPGAVIVFHDVAQSLNPVGRAGGSPLEFASLLSMTLLIGDKYWLNDPSKVSNHGNIAAVRLNNNSCYCIDNLFRGLFISWNYMPSNTNLREYEERIKKEWSNDKYEIFIQALELNTFMLYRQSKISVNTKYIKETLKNLIESDFDIYIYGAGKIAERIHKYLDKHGRLVSGYIISFSDKTIEKEGVVCIEDAVLSNDSKIILGLDERFHPEVISRIGEKFGMEKMLLQNGIGFREMIKIIDDEMMSEKKDMYIDTNEYLYAIDKAENRL